MSKNEILLPRVYMNEGGKYPQHAGKPKLSYSQIDSFIGKPSFFYQYIQQYFFGIELPQGMFAAFGNACGEYLENGTISDMLSESDITVLDQVKRPKNAVYENEIVIDRGSYVIQGFSDQEYKYRKKLNIIDFKTGSKAKKSKYSNKAEYLQSRLYAYGREEEGETIGNVGVTLLTRKGNTIDKSSKNVLRLDGGIIDIPTPYIREEVEDFLEIVDNVALKISDFYKYYLKARK